VPEKKTRFDKQKASEKLFQLMAMPSGFDKKILEKFYHISEEVEYDDTKYKKHDAFFKNKFSKDLAFFIDSLKEDFNLVLVGAYLSYLPNSVTSVELDDTLSVLSKKIEDLSRNIILLNSTISEIVFSLTEKEENFSAFLETKTKPIFTNYSREYSSYIRKSPKEFNDSIIKDDFQKNLYSALQYLKYTIDNIINNKEKLVDPNLLEKIKEEKNKDYFNKISDHLVPYIRKYEYFSKMKDVDFLESSIARDLHTKMVIVFGELYFSEHIKKLTYRTTREKYTVPSFKKLVSTKS